MKNKKFAKRGLRKSGGYALLALCLLLMIGLGWAVRLSIKTGAELQELLESSVKSQLISACLAAQKLIDTDKFAGYNSEADITADWESFQKMRWQLRALARECGAQYIYALKKVGGVYYFVVDTDEVNTELWTAYDLSAVHRQAFRGENAAGMMNVEDEWGHYNTGAIPLRRDGDGEIIGVVAVDMLDKYIRKNLEAARYNAVLLIAATALIIALFLVMLALVQRLNKARAKLFQMANFDVITGLPNRQYLIDYLGKITARQENFALFFIDLDNFKKVNDGSGHDAGDELLRQIADCLNKTRDHAKSFHLLAGALNVSARVGGDEFVQVIGKIFSETEAAVAAEELFANFSALRETSTLIQKYHVGLSVGIALFPLQATDYNVIIKYADIAMYAAKQSGKNQFRIYQDGMRKESAH